MRFWKLGVVFLVFRLIDFLIIFVTPRFIPYLGFFPYKEILADFHLPSLFTSLANFDGVHYLLIAKNGYTTYEQAFFPLYPLLIRILSPLFFHNHLIAALTISNVGFFFGLLFFYRYLKLIFKGEKKPNNKIWLTITFLLLFPTSFFFGAVYTEGLFFFLLMASLYFLQKEKYVTAAVFVFFASLTKLIGFFLIIFLVLQVIKNFKLKIKNYRLLLAFIAPFAGLFLYSLYLWYTTHDPLFFLHSQWAFGAHRSSKLIFLPQVYYRYLRIFITARWNFQYFISLIEFITFNFVFFILVADLYKKLKKRILKSQNDAISLNLFSIANLLLPTLTGTFSSIPRYALFSLSFFIALSQIKNSYFKVTVTLVFIVFHILLLGFFVQGYFVS